MYRANKGNVRTVIYAALLFCLMMAVSAVTLLAAEDFAYAGNKKANTLRVSGKTVKVEYYAIGEETRTVARKKVLIVKGAKGKVTYKITGVTPAKYRKYFRINKKTGKVTVKKGLKEGTYKIKAAVTAAGNRTYKKKTKKAAFKVIASALEEPDGAYVRDLVDVYCSQTARDAYSDDDLEFFIDLLRDKLEPQAVEMLFDEFPCMRAAADQGLIGGELGLYIFCESGDRDGIAEHENAEPDMMKIKDMAVEDGDNVKFAYLLTVDLNLLGMRDEDHNLIRDPVTGKYVMQREGESIELLKDRLAGEMLRALMLDYNRTGMVGATDIRNAVRNKEGGFPTPELEELYSKIVFPKWFTEGAAAAVEDVYRTDREQFKLLRSEENKDLLNNYINSENGFDLEKNVLTCDPDGSGRVSGYLAVLYLAGLSALKTGESCIDENRAVSAEKLRVGLDRILERMHNGETLDQVIYDISPLDSEDRKVYSDTEGFEQNFIKGIKNEAGQYAGEKQSIDFVNTLLDYLEKEDAPSDGGISGGSILTDLKKSCSPLDESKESYFDFLQFVERNELVESTVPNEVALAGGGRSSSQLQERP